MMKVVLVQPPIEDYYDTPIRTYPLGLLYLASGVAGACHLSLLDARTGIKARAPEGEPPAGLADYYRPDRKSPFSLFQKYRRFGMGREVLKATLAAEKPDMVAVSSLFTTYSEEALDVARLAKAACPAALTVLGGTHPTLFPGALLADPCVDFVIRGEGETAFCTLVHEIAEGRSGHIPDVCFRQREDLHIGPVHVAKDIDLLPERSLIDPERYRIAGKKYALMLTSRGCPRGCSFCGKPPVPYRKRSMAGIEADIADCVERGADAIDFQDDMLTGDLRFFGLILDLFKGKGLILSAMNGIYSEGLDAALLDDMYEAGFRRLNFSLVDLSDALLSRQNRAGGGSFITLLPHLENAPFLTEVHFIVGMPFQTPEDVLETIVFLMGRRLLLGPSIFYPAPGSPLFHTIMGPERQLPVKALRSSAMFPANPLFPRPVTYTLMKLVRFVNYTKRLLDKGGMPARLSDWAADRASATGVEESIMRYLLLNKAFTWFDTSTGDLVDEPQDRKLVELFFKQARGHFISGFHNAQRVLVDV